MSTLMGSVRAFGPLVSFTPSNKRLWMNSGSCFTLFPDLASMGGVMILIHSDQSQKKVRFSQVL